MLNRQRIGSGGLPPARSKDTLPENIQKIQTVNYRGRQRRGKRGIIIQFVEKGKSLKKGVDKEAERWYYNKAVARESSRE